jgi:hypothetical protein
MKKVAISQSIVDDACELLVFRFLCHNSNDYSN